MSLPAAASSVNLAWNPNPESDITGYRLSYGTSSGAYSNTLATGAVTTTAVSGLVEGQTYYFSVKAVNSAGLQSDPSAEISYQVPVAGTTPGSAISRAGWTLRFVDSQEAPKYAATLAFDGNPSTFWHTAWTSNSTPPPHELQIDLGAVQSIGGFRYLPRQDAYSVGNIAQYEFYVSMDGNSWGSPAATGTFANSKIEKEVLFASRSGRFVKLRQITEVNGYSDCNVAELNILVGEPAAVTPLPVNEAPVAAAQTVTTAEGKPLAITLSASDANGDALTYSVVSSPALGTLSGTAPNLTYTPQAGATGADSFSFRANDGAVNSNTATVSLTITPAAGWRLAFVTSQEVVAEDGAAINAFDGNPDTMWHSEWKNFLAPPPHEIQIDLGSDQWIKGFSYLPRQDGGMNGNIGQYEFYVSQDGINWGTPAATGTFANTTSLKEAGFTSRSGRYIRLRGLTDANGGSFCSIAELGILPGEPVTVTPIPVNQAPVAAGQTVITAEDKAVAITLAAGDADGDPLTYGIVSGPAKGTLSGSAPNLTYTPQAGATGADSFSFLANDGAVNSNTATISITITPVNDAPVAAAQAISTAEDAPVAILLSATDKDGDPLTYSILSGPSMGTLSGSAPNLTYTPKADVNGPDSFTFRAGDGTAYSNTATVSINVTPVNDTPLASAQSVTTTEDRAVAILLSATDKDGDPLTYSIASPPAKGVLSGSAPNLTYTPGTDANGPDSFSFRASDGTANSTTTTVSITVAPVNDAPVAAAQLVATAADKPVAIVLSASDKDGDPLAYSIVSSPVQGTLSGSAPNLTYTPNTGASGSDSFSFRAGDGAANSNTATVSITITPAEAKPANNPPVFQTALVSLASGTINQGYTGQSLAGTATDPDGGALAYSKVSGPAWLSISAAGELSGTPLSENAGLNSFAIRATDPEGAFAEAVLEIEILSTDLPLPWTLGRIGAIDENATATGTSGSLKIKSSGVLAGAADCGLLTWQTLSGDGEITARISTLENAGSASRVGLMIRDSLAPNSMHAFIGVDGKGAFRWIRRNNTDGSTSSSTTGGGMIPNIWVRLVRSGSTVSAFTSWTGSKWNRVGRTTLPLASSCYIGLAVSGGTDNLSAAVFQNVTIKP